LYAKIAGSEHPDLTSDALRRNQDDRGDSSLQCDMSFAENMRSGSNQRRIAKTCRDISPAYVPVHPDNACTPSCLTAQNIGMTLGQQSDRIDPSLPE
jgi:hypothetical protein